MKQFWFLIFFVSCASCYYVKNSPSHKVRSMEWKSSIRDVPYQAVLLDGENLICGATIISNSWLVSAAHCVEKRSNTFQIRTGGNKYNEGESHLIERIVISEDFDPITLDNDICLIKLTKPLKFSPVQRPIPIAKEAPEPDDFLQISGFGEEGITHNLTATVKVGFASVISRRYCQRQYKEKFMERFCKGEKINMKNCHFQTPNDYENGNLDAKNRVHKAVLEYAKNAITDNMFCTDSKAGDTCKGDSGGPAVVNGKLTGIVSFGDCEDDDFPSIYTKVSNYTNWIEKITGLSH